MNTIVLYINEQPNSKLINDVESVSGWFIDWQGEHVKLSADTEKRLNELYKFWINLYK